jgi:MoaA/NifB/PqqE/SkfB family radical SAM enzyme
MMYAVEDIRQVHLEISSECNAACPKCPRNLCGYPYNDGYEEHSMTLDEAQKIFSPAFLRQLHQITINGNFGDIVMNPAALDIVKYFTQYMNPQCSNVSISTNGGAKDRAFWRQLGELGVTVFFCIDGLEDTHSIYRRNTVYTTVIRNAEAFIAAGGHAVWKMIDFEHNRHQQDQARAIAMEMGFKQFELIDHGRNTGPVYDKDKNLVYVLGGIDGVEFNIAFDRYANPNAVTKIDNHPIEIKGPINCEAVERKSIYITSVGEVYPCCYLGFAPKTFGHGSHNYLNAVNTQLRPLISNNNAVHRPLEECIAWFNNVEKTWDIATYGEGRLIACNNMCGGCKN